MKTIFVSSRLPYHLYKTDSGYESRLSVSGLVSGVQAVFQKREGIWVGWAGESKEICQQNANILEQWEKEGYYAVPIPTDTLTDGLENFCNRSLWSLFHYFINYVDFERSDWDAYKEYNQLFADIILEHYEDGDFIAVQDFQLMLVPKLLREQRPSIKISYFHHITFPTSDLFERLPVGKELIEGVLGADRVGFHTQKHVKAFERSARRFGLDLGRTQTQVNPIGVDDLFWEDCLKKPETLTRTDYYKSCFPGKKIILAVERLDYTKGIVERIKAFGYLLEKYPELHGKVTLIQIAVHSRVNVPLYQTIGEEVDRAVGRLKGQYRRFDWLPIYYTNQGFSQEELCSLYSISDVACVTPLIDGLNLVSKEYVISGGDNRALILSQFAGAADELKDAFVVNPYDYEEVGEAMYKALHTPNVKELKPIVKANTIYNWADRILEGIDK